MAKLRTFLGITAILAVTTTAYADGGSCKGQESRIADLEQRIVRLEETVKQMPLPENMFRTSTGAVFEIVEKDSFGRAIKAPDGTIWSEDQGKFDHDKGTVKDGIITDTAATRACDKIGGALPTKQDFEKLKSYFTLDDKGRLTDQGRKDLHKIFPDMKNRMKDRQFWASSVVPEYSYGAYVFGGNTGFIGFVDYRNDEYSVRCVAR